MNVKCLTYLVILVALCVTLKNKTGTKLNMLNGKLPHALAVRMCPIFTAFVVLWGQIRVKLVAWCLWIAARNALGFILISETCIKFT